MTEPNAARDSAHTSRGPLAERLLAPAVFPRFAADSAELIEAEIPKRGFALRTSFSVVTRIKPDLVQRAVHELTPAFVAELEPCFERWRHHRPADEQSFEAYLRAHPDTVADAMLAVADRRAQQIESRTIHSTYQRVCGRARREIINAMPAIAKTIARYAA